MSNKLTIYTPPSYDTQELAIRNELSGDYQIIEIAAKAYITQQKRKKKMALLTIANSQGVIFEVKHYMPSHKVAKAMELLPNTEKTQWQQSTKEEYQD